MEVRKRRGERAVALVVRGVLVVDDGVVRDLLLRIVVGVAVLLHDGGLVAYLAGEVLELGDARVILGHREVHRSARQHVLDVVRLVHEIEAAVRQSAETRQEQLVERPGVDDGPLERRALDENGGQRRVLVVALELQFEHVLGFGFQAHHDALVVEHALEQRGVALERHALVGVLEVAVVARQEHGHARRHRRIHLLRREPPLLLRVVEEHVLVDEVRHLGEIGVVDAPQLGDGHLALVAERGDELLDELRGALLAEGDLHRVLVERHRHVRAVPVGQHLVLVVVPLGEAADVVERALVVGVEDVRPIAVHEDARLVGLVVHVAGDMGLLLDHENTLAAALCQLARHDAAGEPAAHHHGVEIASIDVMQIAVTHTHGEPSLSVLTRTNRAVAIS